MANPKILVASAISELGIDLLKADPAVDVDVNLGISQEDLLAVAADYDAIIVRSKPEITPDIIAAATSLKAVGRAGVGVDHIDIKGASKCGVVVMNTPSGNTVSTAEHAFSLMLSMARNIPQAHAVIKSGEWEKKKFMGVEINKKTLAILGMGRIGSEFAKRAKGFSMKVVAYDPYLTEAKANVMGVELAATVKEAVAQADFITLHMPHTDETHHIVDEESIASMKDGVRIVNCARGGLVDEAALLKGLESGKVAAAALDVFEVEPPPADFPLRDSDKMIFTPHLGASTEEAQENVGIEIAERIRDFLVNGTVVNSVNMPSVDAATMAEIGVHLEFGAQLGRFICQLAPERADTIEVRYAGNVSELDTSLISRSVLRGYLEKSVGEEAVNQINAPGVAEDLGISVSETRLPGPSAFTDLIEVVASKGSESSSVSGTFLGGKPRIVKIGGRHVEADPSCNALLLLENEDMPGMVGLVGSLLGKHGVNIASMSLGRVEAGETALTLLDLDSEPEAAALEELVAIDGILSARCVKI